MNNNQIYKSAEELSKQAGFERALPTIAAGAGLVGLPALGGYLALRGEKKYLDKFEEAHEQLNQIYEDYGKRRQKGTLKRMIPDKIKDDVHILRDMSDFDEYLEAVKESNPFMRDWAKYMVLPEVYDIENTKDDMVFQALDADIPAAIIQSKSSPDEIALHELGHVLQQAEGFKPPWYSRFVGPFSPTRSPRYLAEVDAWERMGIEEGHPVRDSALKTYELSGKIGRSLGLQAGAGVIGLLGLLSTLAIAEQTYS